MKKILEDIRVIDLTHVWMGPWCTMMLAEMGAEVIKVEPPWGALGRIEERGQMYGGAAPSFHHLNLSKKGLVLNLKDPKGIELIKQLISKSDVIISNYAPGTMEKMGLGYDECKKIHPNIIYCVLSGFGDTGPYSPYSSYAMVAEAIAGYTRQLGDSIDPNGPPKGMVGFFGDLAPATTMAMGIIGAIRYRDKTGIGQKLDMAQFDSMFAYNTQVTTYWLSGKNEIQRRAEDEERRKNAPPRSIDPLQQIGGNLKVKDGYVMVTGMRPKAIEALKEKLGTEEITKEMILDCIGGMTKYEAFHFFAEMGMPCAPVLYASEATHDPQIAARDMIVTVDHPILGKIKASNFALKMSETPGTVTSAAPLLGQHQREIIMGLLGYNEQEFNDLIQEGIIAYQPDIDKNLENWKKSD